MNATYGKGMDLEGEVTVRKEDFEIVTVEDELRVDALCRKLLMRFYLQLLEDGVSPEEATLRAGSADYFVRDFVVGARQFNLMEEHPGVVRQFAGNWYIVNTLDPDADELERHLEGVGAFFRFLNDRGGISASFLAQVERECADSAFYRQRIESFWNISGDGYIAWEKECSLKGC